MSTSSTSPTPSNSSKPTMKFAIAGASGKMGRMLLEIILNNSECELVAALDMFHSPYIGHDAGQTFGIQSGIQITYDIAETLEKAKPDFLIDFTRPEGTMEFLPVCLEFGVKMIIGTTGLSQEQHQKLLTASEELAIVFAPNMSVGVNAVFKLLQQAAQILNLGYDVEVVEAHHRHKVDAPSGTALRMGAIVAKEMGQDLEECATFSREGHTGAREAGTIGFATIRGGDIVGDHTVLFAGQGERIEISHKSSSRQSYAQGALRAAYFLSTKSDGLYDMQDVLGLN